MKRGVKKGDLKGEKAEGDVWYCGMCTCAFMFSTQYPADIMFGYRALVLQPEGDECAFSR